MNALIPTGTAVINNESVNVVNARELWKFLESGTKFSMWIRRRIEEYGFVAGVDFTVPKNGNGKNGQFAPTDYFITLDMAKELAMVENNDRGRQARQYFIEIEKRYRLAMSNPEALADALLNRAVAQISALATERAQLELENRFLRNFKPRGNPGDLNDSGEAKVRFRRGYYCAGNGRSVTALIEHPELPGMFEEFRLAPIGSKAK